MSGTETLLPSSIEINGQVQNISINPIHSLATVLRDQLKLTGTKLGCEAGDCGACTVLINGDMACACLVPVGQCLDASVHTIESTALEPYLGRLRQAFLACGAAQCGICTPGMLMCAVDLLSRNPSPDRQSVEDALGGTLCRCTGYLKIIDAVLLAADSTFKPDAVTTQSAMQFAPQVGQSVTRIDGMDKVSGTALFASDTAPDNALWVRLVRSPHAHAVFELGNFDQLLHEYPGLIRILTAADIPGRNGFGIYPDIKDQPVLADGLVRYQGEPILALVGDQKTVESLRWDTLPIHWNPLPSLDTVDDAMAENTQALHEHIPDNCLIEGRAIRGDTTCFSDETAAAGLVIAGNTFTTPFVEHAYIEPEAGYARRVGDRIEVFVTTQAPHMDLEEVAGVLGIELQDVRIIPSTCGGGFGGKLDVSVQPILAVAAWVTGQPVRMVFNRIESMASSTKRHPSRIALSVAATPDGMLHAISLDGVFNTGAYASWGPTVAGRVPAHCTGPYAIAHVHCRTRAIHTHQPPSGAFRGFGTPQSALAREVVLDQLADQLNLDRWELRHRNAFKAGDTTPTGQTLDHSVGMVACLDALHPAWIKLNAEVTTFNAQQHTSRRRGVGIACMWYGCGNTGLSNPSTLRVELRSNGRLVFYNGAVDIGQGSSTVLLQICADAVGLPLHKFDCVNGDTDLTDDAGKTSASRQTFVSGKAAMLAGLDLRQKLLQLLNTDNTATLALDDTGLGVEGGAERIDFASSVAVVADGVGTFDPPVTPLDADGQGRAYATYAFAAQVCVVEVDTDTGQVTPVRFVAAHDVGRAVNPQLIEGQIQGGIVQGIGMALMEEYLPGRTDNLHDYLIPTFGDIPDIDILLIEEPEPLGPYGAKGVGEPALVPTPAAIVGAIRHATGVTVTALPVLPHRLHQALRAQPDDTKKTGGPDATGGLNATDSLNATENPNATDRLDAADKPTGGAQ